MLCFPEMANPEHLAILKQGVQAWNRWREENPGKGPALAEANLRGAQLPNINLLEADLTLSNVREVNLPDAEFSIAILSGASLRRAKLIRVLLIRADLLNAALREANLGYGDFTKTLVGWKAFGSVTLNHTDTIEQVIHFGPLTNAIDTSLKSKGQLPRVFLAGAAVPEKFIEFIHISSRDFNQLHSCLISYSSKDTEFAKQLHDDLGANGIRCWFAPLVEAIGGGPDASRFLVYQMDIFVPFGCLRMRQGGRKEPAASTFDMLPGINLIPMATVL